MKGVPKITNFTAKAADPGSEPSWEAPKEERNRHGSWIALQPILDLPNRMAKALTEGAGQEDRVDKLGLTLGRNGQWRFWEDKEEAGGQGYGGLGSNEFMAIN